LLKQERVMELESCSASEEAEPHKAVLPQVSAHLMMAAARVYACAVSRLTISRFKFTSSSVQWRIH